jgi:hypothetical protein
MLDVTKTAASCRLYFVVMMRGVNGAIFSMRSRELIFRTFAGAYIPSPSSPSRMQKACRLLRLMGAFNELLFAGWNARIVVAVFNHVASPATPSGMHVWPVRL